MSDIYLAMGIMAALSFAISLLALRIASTAPRLLCDLLGLATVLVMLLYIRDMWDTVWLAHWLPYSSLIVLGNWFPFAVSFLAGLAWKRIPGRIWRKSLSTAALLSIGVYAMWRPVAGAAPVCKNEWNDGISMQTTQASCSAACAATILSEHGISATEQEMAELCLTRHGTYWQGLYRGLKLKTAGTPWDVEVFHWSPNELTNNLTGPAILTVRLDPDDSGDQRYKEEAGWVPGRSHSTILFRITKQDVAEMGDPTIGREQWALRELWHLWHGQGMRLVRR